MNRIVLAAVFLALGASPALAQLPGATAEAMGEELAQQWCANCHEIERGATETDMPPALDDIANRAPDVNWVGTFLQNPHTGMQGINLSRAQIAAIIAYLRTRQR